MKKILLIIIKLNNFITMNSVDQSNINYRESIIYDNENLLELNNQDKNNKSELNASHQDNHVIIRLNDLKNHLLASQNHRDHSVIIPHNENQYNGDLRIIIRLNNLKDSYENDLTTQFIQLRDSNITRRLGIFRDINDLKRLFESNFNGIIENFSLIKKYHDSFTPIEKLFNTFLNKIIIDKIRLDDIKFLENKKIFDNRDDFNENFCKSLRKEIISYKVLILILNYFFIGFLCFFIINIINMLNMYININ